MLLCSLGQVNSKGAQDDQPIYGLTESLRKHDLGPGHDFVREEVRTVMQLLIDLEASQ